MGHVSGKKFGKHSTVIDEIENQVRRLSLQAEITKVACGVIKHTPNRGGMLKIKVQQEYKGILLLTIRHNSTVQRIYLHTAEYVLVCSYIQELFDKYVVIFDQAVLPKEKL